MLAVCVLSLSVMRALDFLFLFSVFFLFLRVAGTGSTNENWWEQTKQEVAWKLKTIHS
jgi:hypothetical protein